MQKGGFFILNNPPNFDGNPAVQNVNLLPKHFRHAAFQPVTNLGQRIERDVLLA